uniref:GST C-terminal domain-containing protein n=1 Tax=Megaselia scalaris TaxID=36166 RepID=T1GT20_MEGSC
MSKPILFGVDGSPPTRFCLLTAKALNLDIEYRLVNMAGGEHRSEEFLKRIHSTQSLHAICTYLIQTYGSDKDQELYPTELFSRALVDQKLYFDAGVVFPKLRSIFLCVFNPAGPTKIPKELLTAIYEAYDFLEVFLSRTKYIAGDNFTVADLCCIATVSSAEFVPIDATKYPSLSDWVNRMKALPYYEINDKGAQELIALTEKLI